ncbi:hypothetical protein TESG_08561 [Trichophyton tonsurans CBS 112818]|uniref:Uncharacterized protein n=1 Tax=Trichophyton tonsurans (strain CBS 112818) TaxID=647933 RepID=F2S5F1_TRIT1|nr:hypothetical protein TESG_08561 [Trichophyton tonsurans CBS 112818]
MIYRAELFGRADFTPYLLKLGLARSSVSLVWMKHNFIIAVAVFSILVVDFSVNAGMC